MTSEDQDQNCTRSDCRRKEHPLALVDAVRPALITTQKVDVVLAIAIALSDAVSDSFATQPAEVIPD
ncbi:hypothetical protein G6L46_16365 [Agrobacterium rhizogenes]|uniref:hypothetical protein n=1 Tax=Rhizobium rhizogenes TaxID=359 RepID=UPI0015724A44|nr:hypothetical protein [Rhizobium rhizogenes]NTF88705.1 hypothetical protein [Rhizobium rhizogenes]